MCQIPNIWHLTYQTLIFMLYEMFQISNSFATCYSTVSYMKPHCSMLQIFLSFFYSRQVSFLLSPLHSLSLPSQSSLLKTSLIYAQDLSTHHLAANLHIPCCRPPIPCLSFLLSMSLYIFPLLTAQDLSPPYLAVNLQSPYRRPSDLLIKSWVWDLGWVWCVSFGSLIDRLGWDYRPVVVSWLWQWLVEFWVGDVCGCSGLAVFVEDFDFSPLFCWGFWIWNLLQIQWLWL